MKVACRDITRRPILRGWALSPWPPALNTLLRHKGTTDESSWDLLPRRQCLMGQPSSQRMNHLDIPRCQLQSASLGTVREPVLMSSHTAQLTRAEQDYTQPRFLSCPMPPSSPVPLWWPPCRCCHCACHILCSGYHEVAHWLLLLCDKASWSFTAEAIANIYYLTESLLFKTPRLA